MRRIRPGPATIEGGRRALRNCLRRGMPNEEGPAEYNGSSIIEGNGRQMEMFARPCGYLRCFSATLTDENLKAYVA